MRKYQKLTALALCLILLLGGCSAALSSLFRRGAAFPQPPASALPSAQTQPVPEEAAPEAEPEPEAPQPLVSGRYFSAPARPDVSFSEMTAHDWTQAELEACAQAIRDAAAANSRAQFHAACTDYTAALISLDTAVSLADLHYSADAGDETRNTLYQDRLQLLYEAQDLYQATMSDILRSETGKILNREFSLAAQQQFAAYREDEASEALALSQREAELSTQATSLMSQDVPDAQALGEAYVELVGVRNQLAAYAGYESYAGYAYECLYNRSYTPQQAQTVWKTAREDIAPLLNEKLPGVQDAARALLERGPDCSEEAVIQALSAGAARLSPEVGEACQYLLSHELYDISQSDTKLPTGYTIWLSEYQVPFIFNAPYGSFYDYLDLFHEFGHFTAFFYSGSDNLSGVSDYDLSELQSQGMEVMFLNFYDELFGADADAIRAQTIGELLNSIVMGALYDEFQQRVYETPDLTPELVDEIFAEVYQSYGLTVYDGYEQAWMQVIHNFQQPMYYISYAMSALPALELYVQMLDSPADALDVYLQVAAMSDQVYYLSEALDEAGLNDPLTQPIADLLVDVIRESGVLGPD